MDSVQNANISNTPPAPPSESFEIPGLSKTLSTPTMQLYLNAIAAANTAANTTNSNILTQSLLNSLNLQQQNSLGSLPSLSSYSNLNFGNINMNNVNMGLIRSISGSSVGALNSHPILPLMKSASLGSLPDGSISNNLVNSSITPRSTYSSNNNNHNHNHNNQNTNYNNNVNYNNNGPLGLAQPHFQRNASEISCNSVNNAFFVYSNTTNQLPPGNNTNPNNDGSFKPVTKPFVIKSLLSQTQNKNSSSAANQISQTRPATLNSLPKFATDNARESERECENPKFSSSRSSIQNSSTSTHSNPSGSTSNPDNINLNLNLNMKQPDLSTNLNTKLNANMNNTNANFEVPSLATPNQSTFDQSMVPIHVNPVVNANAANLETSPAKLGLNGMNNLNQYQLPFNGTLPQQFNTLSLNVAPVPMLNSPLITNSPMMNNSPMLNASPMMNNLNPPPPPFYDNNFPQVTQSPLQQTIPPQVNQPPRTRNRVYTNSRTVPPRMQQVWVPKQPNNPNVNVNVNVNQNVNVNPNVNLNVNMNGNQNPNHNHNHNQNQNQNQNQNLPFQPMPPPMPGQMPGQMLNPNINHINNLNLNNVNNMNNMNNMNMPNINNMNMNINNLNKMPPMMPNFNLNQTVSVRELHHMDARQIARRNFPLSFLIEAQVVEKLARDQNGSRFIQQQIEVASEVDKQGIFDQVKVHTLSLCEDVFGNYVIQKYFEYGSDLNHKELIVIMRGQILYLSKSMYGCRVIQKAIEFVSHQLKRQIVSELYDHVEECVQDQNGNHVIQKMIQELDVETTRYIIASFKGKVAQFSVHPYGCRVIQRLLENGASSYKQPVLDELVANILKLSRDQYGNYVVQHVLDCGDDDARYRITKEVANNVLEMSKHKYSSNVVERATINGNDRERDLLLDAIIGETVDGKLAMSMLMNNAKTRHEPPLPVMVRDQYGNYVIQTLIGKCNQKQRQRLVREIESSVPNLRKLMFGKHILNKIEEIDGNYHRNTKNRYKYMQYDGKY